MELEPLFGPGMIWFGGGCIVVEGSTEPCIIAANVEEACEIAAARLEIAKGLG